MPAGGRLFELCPVPPLSKPGVTKSTLAHPYVGHPQVPCATTAIDKLTEAVVNLMSVTVNVKLDPPAVGVPVIEPLLLTVAKFRPVGSEPDVNVQV
jgi:hypothetical protein